MKIVDKIEKFLGEAKAVHPLGTLYIKWSSIFDNPSNKYDIPLFTKTLKKAGAKKIWSESGMGRSNQPDVVLFTGLSKKNAEKALEKLPVFKKGVIVLDVDW